MTRRIDIGGDQGRHPEGIEVGRPVDDGRDPDCPHWSPAVGYAALAWAVVWLLWLATCELIELIRH